jgi:hypothetical protein
MDDHSLVIVDKSCLVTNETAAYVTITRTVIAAGWSERHPNQLYTLQTISGEILPNL